MNTYKNNFLKGIPQVGVDGLMIKSIDYSYRRPGFNSQQLTTICNSISSGS